MQTTSVSDALQGLTNLDSAIKPITDDLFVIGPAYPVRVRAADNLLVLKAIEEANPGDVLIIDGKGYEQNAICGDFVIGLAKTMGLAGVVIDGVVRDIQGIQSLNYPVFCRGTTVAASDKHGTGETGEPISCGGVPIHPGDLILGDTDGVTVIPKERENETLDKALEKQERDEVRERDVIGNTEAAHAYIRNQLVKAGRA
nr:RraA family protein [Lentibacillus halodurans]